MDKPLHQMDLPLPKEKQPVIAQVSELLDSRTLAIRFKTPEERQKWKDLATKLGHDEHSLARHLLENFTGYMGVS